MQYDKVCLETFLEKQTQLFDEPVAETLEEAEYFLEDSLAVVKKDMKEVIKYFKDNNKLIEAQRIEEYNKKVGEDGYYNVYSNSEDMVVYGNGQTIIITIK